MSACELGNAEGDSHREYPCHARAPQHCGKHGCRRIKQRYASGETRQGERDEPAVTPGLDQKGFGRPIKTAEEIAEAEPESGERSTFEPRASRCVVRMAAVE